MSKKLDVNRDIMLPLIMGLNADITNTNETLRKIAFDVGFREGFNCGVAEGHQRAQSGIREALGIQGGAPYTSAEEYLKEARTRNDSN